jgi:DNA-binding transcriptional ArsR family regulator
MVSLEPPDPKIVDKLSYVLSSGQRGKVLTSLVPGPKTPAQIATETGLRLSHVSRALSELTTAGLAELLTQEARGRLYGPSVLGRAVFEEIRSARGDRVVAPMVRGTHFKNYHHWLLVNHGKKAADGLFRQFGIDPARIDPEGWYPLRTVVQVLETIEAVHGDGSYATVRQLFRDEAGNFSSIRRLASRLLPLSLQIELGPSAYAREFNHGRFEVEVHGRRALLKNYDWINSPARCAGWWGTYEGVLALTGHRTTVRKVACMLKGDPYCGYVVEW